MPSSLQCAHRPRAPSPLACMQGGPHFWHHAVAKPMDALPAYPPVFLPTTADRPVLQPDDSLPQASQHRFTHGALRALLRRLRAGGWRLLPAAACLLLTDCL